MVPERELEAEYIIVDAWIAYGLLNGLWLVSATNIAAFEQLREEHRPRLFKISRLPERETQKHT